MKRKIKVGLIGCGGIMERHISHLAARPEAEVVAMADPLPANVARHKAANPHLAPAAEFDDYKKLLKTDLDAVVIASPHTAHAGQIIDSFKRGIHVLCEKPMVTSIADAVRVMKAEKKYGKVLLLAYQRHYEDTFRYIKRAIESGELGKLNYIQAFQAQEWKWIIKGTWRADPAHSGFGQMSDSGSHLLDILMWTTGLKPARVAALIDHDRMKVDINSAISVEFESGAIGNISIVGNSSLWWEDITINGSKGTLLFRNGTVHHKVGIDGEMRVVAPSPPAWFQTAPSPASNFLDCILGRAENQSPSASGLRVIEICQTATKSAAEGGKMLKVPATKV